MGDQQACRAVNEQVARVGRAALRVGSRCAPAVFAGCGARRATPVGVAVKTDRLVAWREDWFSRQVLD